MHREILTEEQIKLLPFISSFSRSFGLVGGTAIALHLGRRRSIDFDLFSMKPFNNLYLRDKIRKKNKTSDVLVNKQGEYTLFINGVKITFFHYPFKIDFTKNFNGVFRMPDLLTLAAMKAYALGMRAKWKDYVDLYFIIKDHFSVTEIIEKSKQIFGSDFNEKIFRTQLSYFDGINYAEEIIYLPGFETDNKIIEKELIKFSLA